MWWNSSLDLLQKFCARILSCGPIPHHVAFIMDGNRRFSRNENIELSEAYQRGYSRLLDMTSYCTYFGVKEVTFFTFSIDNFSRSQEEVERHFKMFDEVLELLVHEETAMMQNDVRFRVLGSHEYLSDKTKRLIAKLMLMTKDHTTTTVNLALAYGSRAEIGHAMKTVVDGVQSGLLDAEDIDDGLISQLLFTTTDPDVLIRTSKSERLSDFMLWQISQKCHINFLKENWPELNYWSLFKVIFQYQRNIRSNYLYIPFLPSTIVHKERIDTFIEEVQTTRMDQLRKYLD